MHFAVWKLFVAVQLAAFQHHGEAVVYYVTPDPEGPINETCLIPNGTLTPCYQFHQLGEILQEDTENYSVTLLFLEGVHQLHTFRVSYKESIFVAPFNMSSVTIDCSMEGFIIMNVMELHISSVKFTSQYSHDTTSLDPPLQSATITNCEFVGRTHAYSLSFGSVYSVHIENSTFLRSNGAVWSVEKEHKTELVLTNCTFFDTMRIEPTTDGPMNPYQPSDGIIIATGNNGSALYADGAKLTMSSCKFINCSSASGGACHLINSLVSIVDNIFEGNSALQNGGALYAYLSSLTLHHVTFKHNTAHMFGGGLYVYGNQFGITANQLVITANSSFMFNNAAAGGGAVSCNSSSRIELNISNTYFTRNSATKGGSLHLVMTYMILLDNVEISNNTAQTAGGAIHATNSLLDYSACTNYWQVSHNTAGEEGGALYLDTTQLVLTSGLYNCNIRILPEVTFHHNTVTSPQGKGGAIFVVDRDCEIMSSLYHMCFVYIESFFISKRKILLFTSNQASHGSVLYEGLLDRCLPPHQVRYTAHQSGIQGFKQIAEYEPTPSAISSQPMKLCLCSNETSLKTDCTPRLLNVTKMRGEVIELRLAVLDQGGNPVKSIVRSSYKEVTAALDKGEGSTEAPDKCAMFSYHIFTAQSEAELVLEPAGPCRQSPLSTFRVHVTMTPCARGFERMDDRCACDRRLVEHLNISVCSLEMLSIKQEGSAWLRYDEQYLKLSRNCPLDYCHVSTNIISLSSPNEQCANHRSGILCGACQDSHSIALGTSKCLQCTLTTIWLLSAIPIAGIALVALLLACNISASKGTINGIIFYANIISISGLTNLNSCSIHPLLSVFIAWLNLDLGIETCFYPGMDTYQKTWLQFCFPLYIWLLVIAITIASHYSSTAMKLFGTNNIAILATLFLLSYNKILNTIITALTFTDVLVSSAGNITDPVVTKRVWTYDGNVNYLQGKHIPLFVVSLLFLLVLFLPYTLVLTFGQRLRSMRVRCTQNIAFISIMDAYHAPYHPSRRYWTGVMLITRCLLFLAFATYQQDHVLITNMFAITLVVMGILTIKMYARNIYKQLMVDILEVISLLNLGVLSATLYYLKGKGNIDSMCKVVNASISISFITFLSILAYHAYLQARKKKFYISIENMLRKTLKTKCRQSVSKPDADLKPKKSPTRTILELRESLLVIKDY